MRFASIVAALATAACATHFTGAPKVPNGVAGCKTICSSYGMELTGMVALGEYSDGCICQVSGEGGGPSASAAAGAASVAVVTMMREQEEAARRRGLLNPADVPGAGNLGPGRQ
jgi:hypothetical protein